MANWNPGQDPFSEMDLEQPGSTMIDDTSSLRTLVAESMRSTTSNPLSIHPQTTTPWQRRFTSSQDTLVTHPQNGTSDTDHAFAYGNPQPTYLPSPFAHPTTREAQSLRTRTSEDAEQINWLNQRASFRDTRPRPAPLERDPQARQDPFTRDPLILADTDERIFPDPLYVGQQAQHMPLDSVAATNSADYMRDDQVQAFVDSTGRTSPHHFRSRFSFSPEPQVPSYALAADKIMLDTSMRFIDFLPHDPARPAMLVVITQDDETFVVDGLDLDQLEEECPLLAMGFERSKAGTYKNSLEAKSRIIAVSFLRFLCTGSYLITADDGVSLIAPSLLFHAEMYLLADNFDLLGLKQQAQANLTRVTEFACCYPTPPEDLCEASRFVYARLGKQTNITSIFQHYCVNCFHNHNLKDNIPFRQLVDEVPMFGLDLLKTNIERGFNDEGAADIIQLPINPAPRTAQLEAEQLALVDFVYDIWGPRTFATRCGYDSSASSTPSSPRLQGYAILRKGKARASNQYGEDSDASTSASETEGFALVHRPRPAKASNFIDSADEGDLSDWSDVPQDDHDGPSGRPKGKLPIRGKARELHTSSSVATLRPPSRVQTPTPSNQHPPADDASDCSDSGFTMVKPHDQMHQDSNDSDDFEML